MDAVVLAKHIMRDDLDRHMLDAMGWAKFYLPTIRVAEMPWSHTMRFTMAITHPRREDLTAKFSVELALLPGDQSPPEYAIADAVKKLCAACNSFLETKFLDD